MDTHKKYGIICMGQKVEFQLSGLIGTGSYLHNQMPRLLDNNGKSNFLTHYVK